MSARAELRSGTFDIECTRSLCSPRGCSLQSNLTLLHILTALPTAPRIIVYHVNLSFLFNVDFREFFQSNYAELKKLNPAFPILLREGTGADPYLLATYGESPRKLWACSGSACHFGRSIFRRSIIEVDARRLTNPQQLFGRIWDLELTTPRHRLTLGLYARRSAPLRG